MWGRGSWLRAQSVESFKANEERPRAAVAGGTGRAERDGVPSRTCARSRVPLPHQHPLLTNASASQFSPPQPLRPDTPPRLVRREPGAGDARRTEDPPRVPSLSAPDPALPAPVPDLSPPRTRPPPRTRYLPHVSPRLPTPPRGRPLDFDARTRVASAVNTKSGRDGA